MEITQNLPRCPDRGKSPIMGKICLKLLLNFGKSRKTFQNTSMTFFD
jgi:hypothetical protein